MSYILLTLLLLQNTTEHWLAAKELQRNLRALSTTTWTDRFSTQIKLVNFEEMERAERGAKNSWREFVVPDEYTIILDQVNSCRRTKAEEEKRRKDSFSSSLRSWSLCSRELITATLENSERTVFPSHGHSQKNKKLQQRKKMKKGSDEERGAILHQDTHWHCREEGDPSSSLPVIVLGGCSSRAILYSSYALLHWLGFRFYVYRDLQPQFADASSGDKEKGILHHLFFSPINYLSHPFDVLHEPNFAIRGLQPFHDFPLGPDWWNVDGWRTLLTQQSKMRMNFVGLHTYGVGESTGGQRMIPATIAPKEMTTVTQPTVWVGVPKDLEPVLNLSSTQGPVKPHNNANYVATWFQTSTGGWGWEPKNTTDYRLGLEAYFPRDCYTSPATSCEDTIYAKDSSTVFNAMRPFFNATFTFARNTLGIKTCVGTEIPFATSLQYLQTFYSPVTKDMYATTTNCTQVCNPTVNFGNCSQLCKAHDKYLLFSSNQGTLYPYYPKWPTAAHGEEYIALTTWVNNVTNKTWLAPNSSAIPRKYNYTTIFPSYFAGFAVHAKNCPPHTFPLNVYYHNKTKSFWSISYWETQQYAIDRLGYQQVMGDNPFHVCVPFDSTLTAPPSKKEYYEGMLQFVSQSYPIDYYWVWMPETWMWGAYSLKDPVITNAVNDIFTVYEVIKEKQYNFSLGTCGWVLGPAGNRSYLDGVIPEDIFMSSIDMFLGWDPVDPAYQNVTHHQKWVIPWMEDDNGILGAELWVNRTLYHARDAKKYGAEGLLGLHWRLFETEITIDALGRAGWDQVMLYPQSPEERGGGDPTTRKRKVRLQGVSNLTVQEIYADYCLHNIGIEFLEECTKLFVQLDSFTNSFDNVTKLPRPNLGCCAAISPFPWNFNKTSFEQMLEKDYQFATQWENFSSHVSQSSKISKQNKLTTKRWSALFNYQKSLAVLSYRAMEINTSATYLIDSPFSIFQQENFTATMTEFSMAWRVVIEWWMQYVHTTGDLGMMSSLDQAMFPALATLQLNKVSDHMKRVGCNYTMPSTAFPSSALPIATNEDQQKLSTLFPLWVRTLIDTSIEEHFQVEITVITGAKVHNVTFYWRTGSETEKRSKNGESVSQVGVHQVPMTHRRGGTYMIQLPILTTSTTTKNKSFVQKGEVFSWRVEAVSEIINPSESEGGERDFVLSYPANDGEWQSVTVL